MIVDFIKSKCICAYDGGRWKKRVVIRNYIVPLYPADLLQPGGNIDKDGNVEPTGHKQVSSWRATMAQSRENPSRKGWMASTRSFQVVSFGNGPKSISSQWNNIV